jgi:transcriptional regulator with XRE-family HTH domain
MNRAKQLRLDKGLGIHDVGAEAGVGYHTIRKIENGEDVQPASLVKLGSFYDVQPSSLYQPAVFDERRAA